MDNVLETIEIINSLTTHMYYNLIKMDGKTYYLNGGCLELSEILKEVYPGSISYIKYDKTHVITKIGDNYYDASGYVDEPEEYYIMTNADLDIYKNYTNNHYKLLNIEENIKNLLIKKNNPSQKLGL